MAKQGKVKKKGPFMFPWWGRILAWMILWIGVGVSATFTFLYAIEFGNETTSKWLSSMVISFLSSMLITQPTKVILLAIFFSLVIRKPKIEDDDAVVDEEEVQLEFDEQWLEYGDLSHHALKPRQFSHVPVDPSRLEAARAHRVKEVQMYDILREVMLYMIFFSILVVLSYGSQDINSFNVKRNMERNFVKIGDISHQDFMQIRNVSNFWYWTRNTLIPGLRAQAWYNKRPPIGLRGFLDDKVSRIMGYAVMRQLRMGEYSCAVADKMSGQAYDCIDTYSSYRHDTESYGLEWTPGEANERSAAEYTFRKASDLDGYPYAGRLALYGGGGYVWEMRGPLLDMLAEAARLENETWIDRHTRAVFIEFSVYNPNVNLFTICTFLLEMPESGGIVPMYRFDPARLIQFYGSAMLFQIVCQVCFILFIISFLVKEGRKLFRLRRVYFSELWNYVELSVICLSVAIMTIFIIRLIEMNRITNTFKETNGNAYMKFQFVGGWNELFSYVLAFLVFITMVKFIRLLRFNKRMSLLSDTLKHAGKQLSLFSIMYGIIFLSFVQFFHITLLRELAQFATFKHAFETCLSMMLGKFDFAAMTKSNPLSPFFFLLFIVTNVFILLNMFLSIISESFTAVKNDIDKQSNEHEMVDFILSRFIKWKTDKSDKQTSEGLIPKMEDLDKVDEFSLKIDSLMFSLKKVYVESNQFDQMIESTYDKPLAPRSNKSDKYAAMMMPPKRRGY